MTGWAKISFGLFTCMAGNNIPSGLGNDKPSGDSKWCSKTSVEERRLQPPVLRGLAASFWGPMRLTYPLIFVQHVGYQDVHDHTTNTRDGGSKSSGIRSESLRRDLSHETPTSGAGALETDNCALVRLGRGSVMAGTLTKNTGEEDEQGIGRTRIWCDSKDADTRHGSPE